MKIHRTIPWLLWLLATVAIAQTPAIQAAWDDASSELSVTQTPRAFDRSKRVLYSLVTIENSSPSKVEGPFRVVIPSTNIPLASPDGQTGAGEDFVALSGVAALDPGETTQIRVDFQLQRKALSFTTRPEKETTPPLPYPTHVGGPQAPVTEGQSFSLTSAPPTNAPAPVSYSWAQTGGPSAGLPGDLSTSNLQVTAPSGLTAPATLSFTLTVTDGNGQTTNTIVQVTVNPDQVTVDAGNDRSVFPGDLVTLHAVGTGSGGSSSYSWTQVSPGSPTPPLTGGNTDNPSFAAPTNITNGEQFVFEVTFSDGTKSASDRVTISVNTPAPNALPGTGLGLSGANQSQPLLVVAPPASSVAGGSNKALAAVATGGDGAYSWSWSYLNSVPTGATPPTINGPNNGPVLDLTTPTPTQAVVYQYQVQVTDGSGVVGTDTTTLSVYATPGVLPLQVTAPPATATEGLPTAALSSLATGGAPPYSYSWSQNANGGPTVTIQDGNMANAYFQPPPVIGNTALSFRVTVTDANGATASKDTEVLIHDIFSAIPQQQMAVYPFPKPGILGGQTIKLAVGATGGDGNYSWFWEQKIGTPATLSGENTDTLSVTPAVAPPGAGLETLTFEVTATDGNGQQASTFVDVDVLPSGTTNPLALSLIPDVHVDEGRQGVAVATVASGGTGNYTYSWHYEPSTAVPNLDIVGNTDQTDVLVFNAPTVNAKTGLIFTLVVNDGQSSVAEHATVWVNHVVPPLSLNQANTSPVKAQSGDLVALNGPRAFGGEGPYTYSWTQPTGTQVVLSGDTTPNPVFTAPSVTSPETLVFEMTVTDSLGNTSSSTETVNLAPLPSLQVSLSAPGSIGSGEVMSLNTSVTGGAGPYSYSYSSTGVALSITPVANPSLSAPTVSNDTDVVLSVVVRDANGATATASATTKVTAPAPSVIAFECSGLNDCLLQPSSKTILCPAGSMPYTFISTVGYDFALMEKGCKTTTACIKEWWEGTSDMDGCLSIDNGPNGDDLSCTFCCTGDRCNKPGPLVPLPLFRAD